MTFEKKVSNSKKNNELGNYTYTSYSKLSEVKLITIGLASPERIKQWAEKTLPNGKILGEVINANTLHHKTFKPQKGGLFCERIFGPLKDFECACGKPLKYKKLVLPLEKGHKSNLLKTNYTSPLFLKEERIQSAEPNPNKSILGQNLKETKTRNFCNTCEVEYTWSVMRRYQLGYIKLISPITHVWYLKGNPSYLSILLDIKKRHLEYITYCSETLTLENALKGGIASSKSSDIVSSWNKLKQEIMLEKTINLSEKKLDKRADINIVRNKIEKRESLKLKKYKYWKLFYNDFYKKAHSNINNKTNANEGNNSLIETKDIAKNANNWYDFLVGSTIQFKSTKPNIKEFKTIHNFNHQVKLGLKTYANSACWELEELKILSFIITQEKQVKLINRVEDQFFQAPSKEASPVPEKKLFVTEIQGTNFINSIAAKQILKKMSIPFYIILNLNVFSQKSIYKNFSERAWKKLSEKAFKKSLIRVNKIFNKMQQSYFKQNWLDNIINIETLNKKFKNKKLTQKENQRSKIISKENSFKENKSSFYLAEPHLLSFRDKIFYSEPVVLSSRVEDKSINSLLIKKGVQSIKKYFYNLLNAYEPNTQLQLQDELLYIYKGAHLKAPSCLPFSGEAYSSQEAKKKNKAQIITNKSKPYSAHIDNRLLYRLKGDKKALFIKSLFYLEFYTLSNFPRSLANLIISDFLIKKHIKKIYKNSFKIKGSKEFSFEIQSTSSLRMDATYQIVIKNLSEIFFKFFIKNAGPALRGMACDTFKTQTHDYFAAYFKQQEEDLGTGSEDLTRLFKYSINKKDFKEFKKSLGIFYLVAASKKCSLATLYKKKLNSKKFNLKIKKQEWISLSQAYPYSQLFPSFKIEAGYLLPPFRGFKSRSFFKAENYKKQRRSAINSSLLYFNNLEKSQLTSSGSQSYDSSTPTKKKELGTALNKKSSTAKSPFGTFCGESVVGGEIPLYNDNVSHTDSTQAMLFQQKNETSSKSKKLYNNIYSLSHRERWEVENDWNFLYYFMTAPLLDDTTIIANYKDNFEEPHEYGVKFAAQKRSEKLTYQNISFNLQKSAFFSGPGIVQQLLNEFNFYEIKKMDKQNRILLYQLNKQIFKLKKNAKRYRSAKKELKESYKKRDLLIRRTKLVRKLFIKESSPQATILTILPVLPPDLRPIVKIGGQIAASDLNRLYQRVIYRNDRLKKFLKDPATSHSYEMKYAQRLLQEAVDNLIQNGKSGVVSEKDSRGRALKSLSDILKGKQGRFRQYLLGKRVDYSGRSVIVVGPKLKLHECGIPKEMALELYLPFLLKRILNENLARTVVGAKTLIKTNPSLIWELLREIMQTCPVLLNRAPTLHRLGIQAFQPKLIDGRAILLHPLVCSAFNADFDGDQMAVHVPITIEARAEAWKLMLSRNNILSPATGEPLAIPSQDMVLGCYYLTTNLLNNKIENFAHKKGSGFYFSSIDDALKDYELQEIDLHANIWLKWNGFVENGSDQEEPIEIRIDSYGNWKEIYNKSQKSYNSNNSSCVLYILTTPGKILFNQIINKSLKLA